MKSSRLDKFDNSWFKPGSLLARILWYWTSLIFVNSYLLPISSVKVFLLRLFGAVIGKGVVIKPKVNIKYPWKLKIGEYSWIGEKVWIDNIDFVEIGKHCCLSQASMLLCGNHDYSKESFDLIAKPIKLEDGVWIGAKSLVAPGVTCKSHSVLSAYSFASKDMEPYGIYSGNPAERKKDRIIT